jgi:hypothetical protein
MNWNGLGVVVEVIVRRDVSLCPIGAMVQIPYCVSFLEKRVSESELLACFEVNHVVRHVGDISRFVCVRITIKVLYALQNRRFSVGLTLFSVLFSEWTHHHDQYLY